MYLFMPADGKGAGRGASFKPHPPPTPNNLTTIC